jgi:hypothetical protein
LREVEQKQERTSRAVSATAPASAAPRTLMAETLELQRTVGNRQLSRLLGFGKKSSGPTNVQAVDKAKIDYRILAERAMHTITEAIDAGKDYAVERVAGTPHGADAGRSRMLQLITKAKTDMKTALSAMPNTARLMQREGKGLADAATALDAIQANDDFFLFGFTGNVHELAMIRTRLLHALSGASTPGKAQITGHYGGAKERQTTYDDEMTDSTKSIIGLVLALENLIGPGKRYATLKEGMKAQWGWGDAEMQRHFGEKANIARVKALSDDERAETEVKLGTRLTKRTREGEKPFTTKDWFSKFKGNDFGIWVMDATGRIYSGEHKVALFHHSTFLRGGDVVSAGEWKVIDGKLEHITNKSGHYFPDNEQLRNVLSELATQGVPLAGVRVTQFTGGHENERTDKDAAGILAELGGRLAAPQANARGGEYGVATSHAPPPNQYAMHQDPNDMRPVNAAPQGPRVYDDDAYNTEPPAARNQDATHLPAGPQPEEDPYNNEAPGPRNRRPRSWRYGRRL